MILTPSNCRIRFACVFAVLLAAALLNPCVAAAEVPAPPPVVFEGLGLENFSGAESVAAALLEANTRTSPPAEDWRDGIPPLDLRVRGPSGRGDASLLPLAAEVKSRIDAFDVAAGLQADSQAFQEGRADWTGRIGLKAEHEAGSEGIEFRTLLGRRAETGVLGIELGPRIERRLGRGMMFFIDGKAEARALRNEETGWYALPGTSTTDGMVGVTARTGLVR